MVPCIAGRKKWREFSDIPTGKIDRTLVDKKIRPLQAFFNQTITFMLDVTLNWTPNPEILEQLLALSTQKQKSLEVLLSEAVLEYLDANHTPDADIYLSAEDDPIVGLYEGSPDLSSRAEEILLQDIDGRSGWTCKE